MALKVGAAKACINPTPDLYPIPSSFADWGVAPLLQECPYDDMFCRAIAIDNGEEITILMTWDTMGYPGPPTILEDLSREFNIPKTNFMICGTHNHSCAKDYHVGKRNGSPAEIAFHEKYWIVEMAAAKDAVRQALDNMQPAKYGFGEVNSYLNVNRDVKTPHGYWIEGKNFEGYSDHTLATIKFVDLEGNLICAFCNFPMHNTCIHMMKDFDGKSKTSGNVSGIACNYAEMHYGNNVIVAWSSGAAGNQNPIFSHNLQYEYADGYSTSVPLPDGVGYMLMEYCGRNHGVDIVKGIDAIDRYSEILPIHHVFRDVLLPAQKRADNVDGHGTIRMGGNVIRNEEEIPFGQVPPVPQVPEMIDDPENPVNLQMQLHLLGDVALVCANAELYCEIGREMKAASPFKKTIVVTHTDDKRKGIGYIMDKSAAERKEKVFQSFGKVKPGAAEPYIIENQLKMFEIAMGAKAE